MKKTLRHVLILVLLLLSISCEEEAAANDEDGEKDQSTLTTSQEDSIADLAWDEMMQVFEDNQDINSIPENAFASPKLKFEEVLQSNEEHPKANLGLSMIEQVNFQFDSDLTGFIDDFEAEFLSEDSGQAGKSSGQSFVRDIFSRPYSVLAKSTKMTAKSVSLLLRSKKAFRLSNGQATIDTKILPKLYTIISYLDHFTSKDSNQIAVSIDGDSYIVDAAEVHVLKAGLHAVVAGLELFTLLDFDILDDNDSYAWFDAIKNNNQESHGQSYRVEVIDNMKHLYITNDYGSDYKNDSTAFHWIKYNLENRSGFLAARSGKNNGGKVIQALQGILSNLKAADHFVRNVRSSDTEQNILRLSFFTDADNEINPSADGPNFAANWNSLTDVITFVEGLLNGTTNFTEDVEGTEKSFSLNISAFFNNFSDVQNLLPLYQWKSENWSNRKLVYSSSQAYFGNDYYIWWTQETISSVDSVHYDDYDTDFKPIDFLDEQGNVIDVDVEKPYFSDYSFGGLFPGLDRTKFLDLIE